MNIKQGLVPHCQKCKKTNVPMQKNGHNNMGRQSYMCRECNSERMRMIRSTPEGRATVYKSVYASEKRSPERKRAQTAVYQAIQKGIIFRPSFCQVCRKECKPEGHHEDYERKLEVTWVCKLCHVILDKTRRERLVLDKNL